MIKFDIRDLSFSYGEFPVLKNLKISINENTVNVILGLNGSGKTTLIKLMTGVLSAPKDAIFIDQADVTQLPPFELSKKISYVPQSISDDNDFLVQDYLTFGRMNSKKQLMLQTNFKSSSCSEEK